MTVSFVIFTIVYGTVSSILGTYIVRILDKKCKNDRHSSDSCLLYTSPSPRDTERSRMPSSA